MIDVHILMHEGTRRQWLDQCLESLRGQPCIAHVIDNVGASVGAGRAKGFSKGIQEFVAYVDSDDFVLPGCFETCLRALETDRAVITMERVLYEDGSEFPFPKPMHNVAVYRRADIEPLLEKIALSHHTADHHTRRALKPNQLDFVGYAWRCHPGGDHHQFTRAYKAEHEIWRTDW